MDSSRYPYVVLPKALQLYWQGPELPPPPIVAEPQLPLPPAYPQPPKMPQPVMSKLQALARTGVGLLGLVTLILAKLPGWVTIVGMGGGVVWLARHLQQHAFYKSRLRHYYAVELPRYQKNLQNYSKRYKAWELACQQRRRRYARAQAKADQDYKRKVQQIQEQWRLNRLEVKSRSPNASRYARAGRFDQVLRNSVPRSLPELPGLEITLLPPDHSLSIDALDPFSYTPDVAVQISYQGKVFFLDLENDEPWFRNIWGERQATHALDCSRQKRRDQVFAEAGWIVVRFAEQQLALEPGLCGMLIADLMRSLYSPTQYPHLAHPAFLSRWTTATATQWERFTPGERVGCYH